MSVGRAVGTSFLRVVGMCAVLSGVGFASQHADTESVDLDTVLERARLYVASYEEQLGTIIAEEEYRQQATWLGGNRPRTVLAREERRLSSDFLLVRVGGQWQGIRTVRSVDGNPVEQPEVPPESLEELIVASKAVRYDLGGFARTFNVPTFGLTALRPGMSSRFAFEEFGERETVDGVPVWEVHFSEVLSPTLVMGGFNEDRPANGRMWVNPETGEVLRTELILKAESGGMPYQATMDVTYEASEQLGMLVPGMMQEHYESELHTVETRADYQNFQRFSTETSFSVGGEETIP